MPPGVEIIYCPIEDPLLLRRSIEGCQGIIHAAGQVSFSNRDYNALLLANRDNTAAVVNAALETGVPSLVHISSVAAIPHPSADPRTSAALRDFSGPYGYSKHLAEREVQRGQAEGLHCAIIRSSVVLSRHPEPGRSSSSLIDSALRPRTVVPPGSVHIVSGSDVADACQAALQRLMETPLDPMAPPPIYLLDGGRVTYADLYQAIRYARGVTEKPIHLPPWALSPSKPLLSLARAFYKGPLPTRRQLSDLLKTRDYGPTAETETLLGRPLKSLNEAVEELNL